MPYWNLKAEMKRNGISVAQIADAANKSVPAVSKNLNGHGRFSVEEGLNIRNKFFPGLSIDYLFSRVDANA